MFISAILMALEFNKLRLNRGMTLPKAAMSGVKEGKVNALYAK